MSKVERQPQPIDPVEAALLKKINRRELMQRGFITLAAVGVTAHVVGDTRDLYKGEPDAKTEKSAKAVSITLDRGGSSAVAGGFAGAWFASRSENRLQEELIEHIVTKNTEAAGATTTEETIVTSSKRPLSNS